MSDRKSKIQQRRDKKEAQKIALQRKLDEIKEKKLEFLSREDYTVEELHDGMKMFLTKDEKVELKSNIYWRCGCLKQSCVGCQMGTENGEGRWMKYKE
jgi:hypothetical protein